MHIVEFIKIITSYTLRSGHGGRRSEQRQRRCCNDDGWCTGPCGNIVAALCGLRWEDRLLLRLLSCRSVSWWTVGVDAVYPSLREMWGWSQKMSLLLGASLGCSPAHRIRVPSWVWAHQLVANKRSCNQDDRVRKRRRSWSTTVRHWCWPTVVRLLSPWRLSNITTSANN